MRRLILLAVVTLTALASWQGSALGQSPDLKIEAVIWQFNRDYPGADQNDANLPIKTVYIKTHDGTDWMSTYDPSPHAVSGPDALRRLIQIYSYQGIDVVAWFVPYGSDIEGQLQRAREVLDTGVKGLIADVEPYRGFCHDQCAFLAEQFWKRLRQERPAANLGVTYDPRTQWHGPAALAEWLSVADMAAPECYWETFAGQGVWGDPGGCLIQAKADIGRLVPNRNIEFAPMLQGDTSPGSIRAALDTAAYLGASRVSLWRRGVVPAEVWNEVRTYVGMPVRPCWVTLSDNCLVQEPGDAVFILQGGARFGIAAPDILYSLGYDFSDVNVVPDGFVDTLPLVPRDGTLLKEAGMDTVWVVYAGARFGFPNPAAFESIGMDWGAVRAIPPGTVAQIPSVPADYNRFREVDGGSEYTIIAGKKLALDPALTDILVGSGFGAKLYTLWDGALDSFPDLRLVHGDASCDEDITAVDALSILRRVAGIRHPAAVCAVLAGNVDCDGDTDAVDALKILRWIAGLDNPQPSPSPVPTPTPTETPTPAPQATPTAPTEPTPAPDSGMPTPVIRQPSADGGCPPIGAPLATLAPAP